jgi:hypothetical protein
MPTNDYRLVGPLTPEHRCRLRSMVVKATELINAASGRLALSSSDTLDEKHNSWWREYDKQIEQAVLMISSYLEKYRNRKHAD